MTELMDQEVAEHHAGQAKVRKDYERTRAKLESERELLLHAYYAKALPLELFKKEQDRIGSQAEALQAEVEGDVESLEYARGVALKAIDLLENCHKTYVTAAPQERR